MANDEKDFSSIINKAKIIADSTVQRTRHAAKDAGEKTKKAAAVAGEKSKEIASVVGKKTKGFASVAGEKTKEISKEAGKKISKAYGEVKEKIAKPKTDAESEKKKTDQVKLDDLLHEAVNSYNAEYTTLSDKLMDLYTERERSIDLISNVEMLVNSIANRPKSFDTDIAEIEANRTEFKNVCDFAKEELNIAKKTAASAGAGVAAGAAVASFAPTVAMWIATTFGTASTGTAISALSGAAATKAALAWIGGGAVAAGGGGAAAGSAFLAFCGPIGWGLAGATLFTSVVLFAKNKAKLNKEKKDEIVAVKKNTAALRETNAKIGVVLEETITLRSFLFNLFEEKMPLYSRDYLSFSDEDKLALGTLVNNTKSLSASLSKTV